MFSSQLFNSSINSSIDSTINQSSNQSINHQTNDQPIWICKLGLCGKKYKQYNRFKTHFDNDHKNSGLSMDTYLKTHVVKVGDFLKPSNSNPTNSNLKPSNSFNSNNSNLSNPTNSNNPNSFNSNPMNSNPTNSNPMNLTKDEIDNVKKDMNEYNKRMLTVENSLQELQKKVRKLQAKCKDKKQCVICWERERNYILIPCGHYMLCGTCACTTIGKECPYCRKQIYDIQQVFDNGNEDSSE